MKNIFIYIHIVVSLLLILSILLQQRGQALGSAFGGESGFYISKRGFQKKLHWITIFLGLLFLLLSLLNLVL